MQIALVRLIALAFLLGRPLSAAELETVSIAFTGGLNSDVGRGVLLGLEEANQMGHYFGFRFVLSENPDAALLIAATEAGADLAASNRTVVSTVPAPRGACRTGLFHVAPSHAMCRSAVEQWERVHQTDAPAVETWNSSLVRFAARDLNGRYRKKFQAPMTGPAWAGWAAARSFGEAVVRTRKTDSAAIAAYFLGEFALDGQKGQPLRFRPNHQLRQPLYYVSDAGELVGEAPLQSAQGGDGARDLDSLGETECTAD